jgi:hypothetical protein
MASAVTTVTIVHNTREPVATTVDRLQRPAANDAMAAVARELDAIAAGTTRGGKVTIAVDATVGTAPAGIVVVDKDHTTAGDQLLITLPSFPTVSLVAVALTATVTASPHTGLWSLQTATSDAQGASLASAINNHSLLGKYLSAANSSGTVTITSLRLNTIANGIVLGKKITDSAGLALTAFTGGSRAGSRAVATVVIDESKLTANDTLQIGKTTFTWKASAAAEGEVTIGVSSTAAGDNLLAKVIAHSALKGLISGTSVTGTVTLTWLGPPRTGEHVYMVKVENTPSAMTLTQMATPSTESYGSQPVTYTMGVA